MATPETMNDPARQETQQPAAQQPAAYACPCWLWGALAMSFVGALASLLLTWTEGKTACPLCFYQRVFMMAVLGTLVIGVFLRDLKPGRVSLLALPSAMGGFAVAVFHVNLVASGKLECPNGFFNLGSAPLQSLIAFTLVLLLLGGDLIQAGKLGHGIPAISLAASVFGLLFAVGLIYSGPPMPNPSTFDYTQEPKVCRPAKPA